MTRSRRTEIFKIVARILFAAAVVPASLYTRAFSQNASPSPVPFANSVALAKCWSYPTGETYDGTLVSDGGKIFLGRPEARIEALTLDGKKMWATELGGEVSSNLLVGENSLFLVTSSGKPQSGKPVPGILRNLSKDTGITNWTLRLTGTGGHSIGLSSGMIIVVSNNGVVESVDVKSGVVKWKRELSESFQGSPVFTTGDVFIASLNSVFGVSLPEGEITLVRKLTYPITAIAGTEDGKLIVGDARGNISSYSVLTGKINWNFKSGGEVSELLSVDQHILAASHDNFVYWINQRNGNVEWKKRMSGRVTQAANVLDQFAILTGFDDHAAILAERLNGRVASQIVLNSDESISGTPIETKGLLVVLTNQSASGYRINSCEAK